MCRLQASINNRKQNMNIHPTLVILVVLLCIGYVLQNMAIYRMGKTIELMRKNTDKQIELTEKQIDASHLLINAMGKIQSPKAVK